MGFFSRKQAKLSYLGFDIGDSGLKIVQLLNEKGVARLVTYAYAGLPVASLDEALGSGMDTTAAFIKKVCATAKTDTKLVVGALPISSIFSSIISVTAATEKELEQGIRTQAGKLIPGNLEDVNLTSKVIDSTGEGSKKVSRVLLTGAPKALVQKYLELMQKADLQLLSLETEVFAEIRSLIGKDRMTIMIIDMGSMRTSISIIEKGIPYLNRSIATGGVAISQAISKTLGVPFQEAENMKRDIRSMQTFAQAGDIAPILSTLLKPVIEEIRYCFNLYQSQSEEGSVKRIDKIILTGGSSLLPKLPEFVTQLLNINTYLGDPWARVVHPADLRPILDEIGPRFPVAVGCAMRDIE